MNGHIGAGAEIRTDGWAGYKGLEEGFPEPKREKPNPKERTSHSCTARS